ncbi:hypothetical protein BJX76DRAFT_363021 [Aspergillus varians]
MDHIPRVRNSNLQTAHLTVPYLARKWEYGRQRQGFDAFLAFPAKHGFSSLLDEQLGDDAGGLVPPSVDFLQAWLYFGLLAEAFGTSDMQLDPSQFIAGDAVITAKDLNRYIWYWAATVAHGVRDEIDEHAENLDKCVEAANVVVNAFWRRMESSAVPLREGEGEEKGGQVWSSTTAVLFSIITLVDYLRRARLDINIYTFEANLPVLEWEFPPLDKALAVAGWCEGEISRLRGQTDCSTRFYLAQIDRWAQGRDHRRCSVRAGCQAHQIDESTYRTRHRPDCRGDAMCWSVGPAVEDITNVIAGGGYPVVNISDNGRGVEAHPVKQDGDLYVTISHVWSDGLGNPHDNTLPYCQLVYIQGLVNALYPESCRPVKFWLDTLCIPVGTGQLPLRRLAINRMGETFRRSDKTLALDNSLMAQGTDVDWVEMNMRIKYCPWVSRAWTLLEGRVGKELLFQCKDNAVPANVVFNRSYAAKNIAAVSGMLQDRGVEGLLHEPAAIQLIRALTLQPRTEMQSFESNEDGIAYRDTVRAAVNAYDTWMPILQSAGLSEDLSEIDDDMRANIQTRVFCPVIKHSNFGTRNIRDEFWLESIESSRADSTESEYKAYFYFEGVCRAFRGRTTSKAEDEAICFGQMLGIDTSQLVEVSPLTSRARYWLTILDSHPALRTVCWAVGIEPRAKLIECQERRIKILLLDIGKLPLSILLWTAPRMKSPGWKWAPLSLLDATPGLDGTWASNERGTVEPDGLTVQFPALKLTAAGTATRIDLNISSSDPVHFAVSIKDDGIGSGDATSTFKVCFEITESSPWNRCRTWSALIRAGIVDRLVILTRRRASVHDPFQNRGVLLEFHGRRHLVNLGHFRAVVERPHGVLEERLPVIPLDGVWDVQSTWCVG